MGSTVNTSIPFSIWGVKRRELRHFEEEIESFKMTQVSSLNSPYRERYGRVDGGTQPSFPTSGRIHICRFLQSRAPPRERGRLHAALSLPSRPTATGGEPAVPEGGKIDLKKRLCRGRKNATVNPPHARGTNRVRFGKPITQLPAPPIMCMREAPGRMQ